MTGPSDTPLESSLTDATGQDGARVPPARVGPSGGARWHGWNMPDPWESDRQAREDMIDGCDVPDW